MFVCSCFGITEERIREHAAAGACSPRQIASASKAGTDCGKCVRRIQALLGRGPGCADGQPSLTAASVVPTPTAEPAIIGRQRATTVA